MKRYFLTSVLVFMLFTLSSCEKAAVYHSGEMVLDGTTVRYLASENDLTLKITAEGSIPTSPICVKLMNIQSSSLIEWWVIDSIVSTPYESGLYLLYKNREYGLFLEKDGEAIGIGQFNF